MRWILLVQERTWDWWGGHPMAWGWGLWGAGMMLMMLLFWALVIVGFVLGIRWVIAQGRERETDRALQTQRFARGEIGREEFENEKARSELRGAAR